MSRSIRSYPKHEQAAVIERRLKRPTEGGLGTLAAQGAKNVKQVAAKPELPVDTKLEAQVRNTLMLAVSLLGDKQ